MLRDLVVVKIHGFIGIVHAELANTIVIALSILFFSLCLIVHYHNTPHGNVSGAYSVAMN
jgi:multisubunit Na+/H+ antiporter MnhB subunit